MVIVFAFTVSYWNGCSTDVELSIKGPFPTIGQCEQAKAVYTGVPYSVTACWEIPEEK